MALFVSSFSDVRDVNTFLNSNPLQKFGRGPSQFCALMLSTRCVGQFLSQVLGFGWFVVLQDACLREPRTAASPFPSSSEDEEVGAAAASGGLSLSLPEGACTTGMLWLRDLAVVEGVENLFPHVGKAALQFGRVVLRSSPSDVGLPWGALGPGPKRGGG